MLGPAVSRPEFRSLVKNVGWLVLERIVRLGAVFGTSILIARHLGPERFGAYSYAVASVLLVAESATLGLAGIVTRDLVRKRTFQGEILGTAFVLRFAAGVLVTGLLASVAGPLSGGNPEIRILIQVMAVWAILRSAEVFDLYFQAQSENRFPSRARLIATFVYFAAVLALIQAGASTIGFSVLRVLDVLVFGLAIATLYLAKQAGVGTWTFSLPRAKSMLAQSWPLLLSGFGASLYLRIDQVMLGRILGEGAVGQYAVAVQFSEVWYFLPVALMTAAFPGLTELHSSNKKAYLSGLQTSLDILAWLGIAIGCAVAIAAPWLIPAALGEPFRPAVTILMVHIWAGVFMFMRTCLSKWLLLEELYGFSLVTHGLGAVTNIVINLLLIPAYGTVGAAIATLLSYAVATYLSLFAHPRTRPLARMMTVALLAPLKWITPSRRLWRA